MKRITIRTAKTLLAAAAITGIVIGGGFVSKASAKDQAGEIADKDAKEKAKCETHDCKGKNTCKGKGGCKTDDNKCAGKNACKGKGGCAVKDGKPLHPKGGDKKAKE